MGAVPKNVADFLASYDPKVRDLALETRNLVLKAAPGAAEEVHRGWKTISYGAKSKFCAVSPHKSHINLQFHAGAALADPRSLLEGTGKSMRHVKLCGPSDLRRPGLKPLVRAAAANASA